MINLNDEKFKSFAIIIPKIKDKNNFLSKFRRMLIRPLNISEEDFDLDFEELTLFGCCMEAEKGETKSQFLIRATLNGCEPFLEIEEDDEHHMAKMKNLRTDEVYYDGEWLK